MSLRSSSSIQNSRTAAVCHAGLTRCGLLCLAAMSLLSGLPAGANAALVQFRSVVTVGSPVVRLMDVADIRDASGELAHRLEEVELCPAPAAGRSHRLDFETIRGRLAARGIPLSELEFSGTSVIQVNGPEITRLPGEIQQVGGATVSEATQERTTRVVEQAIAKFVRQQAPEAGTVQVALRLTPEQAAMLLASGGARLQVAGGRAPWVGVQDFVVRAMDQRGADRQLVIRCAVTPLPRVLVPRFAIPKGQIIKEEDLVWQQVEKLGDGEGALVNLPAVVGQETRRTLRPGKTITPHDIRGVPMIRSGELITVYSKVGSVIAQTAAKSGGDGGYGEMIPAVSVVGRERLIVRVAGYHQAFVVTSEDLIRKDQQERLEQARAAANDTSGGEER